MAGTPINHRNFSGLPLISRLLAFGLVVCVALYYIPLVYHANLVPVGFLVVNFFVITISTYLCINGSRFPFSLYTVFYVFSLIFYGLIPLFEYSYNIVYWNSITPVFDVYAYTSTICLISIILFHIFYGMFTSRAKRFSNQKLIRTIYVNPYVLLGIGFISATIILYTNNFSILSMLVRGGDYSERKFDTGTAYLLYQYAIFPIPSVCFVIYMLYGKRKFLFTLLLLILFLVFNPVTGMARFQAATLYIAVIASALPNLLRVRHGFSTAMMFGLFFINPLVNQLRYYNGQGLSFKVSWDFISSGEFDSFQNFATALYMNEITYGRQLLGVILFFIPRSIWPDKPIGSGAQIANDAGFSFSTISMNLLGEGYINFGIPGVIIFVIIASAVATKLDHKLWTERVSESSVMSVFYLFLLGLFFFMIRGDLLSSFAYTIGMLFSVSFVWLIAVRRRHLRL